ncbi:MAG TPA: hypothetical protein VFN13_01055 [Rudaea sp.]|nr:hypothetical protein [Rudaea sp.]
MKIVLIVLFLIAPISVVAETFTYLTPNTCPASSSGLFTTGQQYVDASNGVLQDSWSMLVRWQGSPSVGQTQWISDPLYYNAGVYTGYTPPTPYSAWQRGYQPENQMAATSGVQLNGCHAGMLINTWYTPHAGSSVVGGYFNDMYGYAWSAAHRPWAFKKLYLGGYIPTELVLQGTLAVPQIDGYEGAFTNGSWSFTQVANLHDANHFGHIEYSLFAYIADTSHPNLHPIAIIATIFENGIATPNYQCPLYGNVSYDYAPPKSAPGKFGVWYASSGICTTDVTQVRYSAGYTTGTPFSTPKFFRIHFTPQNLINIVSRINTLACYSASGSPNDPPVSNSCGCTPGTTCPSTGYSTDPNVYNVQYEGVILELAPCDENPAGRVYCSTNLLDASDPRYNPNQDSNLGAAVSAYSVQAFSYTNP